jgi:SAM-dependent methyltransferase
MIQYQDWFAYKDIYDQIYDEMSENGTFLEIGSLYGTSTVYFAKKIKAGNKKVNFYCVDIWQSTSETEPYLKHHVFNESQDIYLDFLNHLRDEEVEDYVTHLRSNSKNIHPYFLNKSLDAIMLDGDHRYEGLKSDIINFLPKMKVHGKMYGDDYGHPDFPGIKQAVNEMFSNVVIHDSEKTFYKIWETEIL